ncbi:hypothetical protein OAU50_06405 [Planctomycetota bacterium]|nr:hypothetical protein [Planctomycetota bacterium]
MMRVSFVLLLLLVSASSATLHAEDQLQYPRVRTLQDMIKQASGDSRYKDGSNDMLSLGFSAGWQNEFAYRDFKLFDSGLLFDGDAYVNFMGVEASAWAMWDLDNDRDRPVLAVYSARYKFHLEGALMSLGYKFNDFSGSDGDLGSEKQGFGKNGLLDFPDNKFPSSLHEAHLMMSYFTGAIQETGANMRFSLNYWQRLDDEGSRVEMTVALFVNENTFTIFGDFIEIATTTTFQHRYLNNNDGFPGQMTSGRIVYDLDKYNIFPMFIQLDIHYFVAFDKEYADGLYFGASANVKF